MSTSAQFPQGLLVLLPRVFRYIRLSLALLAFCAIPAQSQTIATVSGPFPAPVFVNIYWDAAWDADNPGFSSATMNTLTAAVINSSYMGGLAEYGVATPTFGGGFLASSSCIPTAPTRVPIFDLFGPSIQSFVNCEVSSGGVPVGPSVIYNVIMPPATLESDLFGAVLACGGSTFSAYHFHSDFFSGGAPFTAIFANSACGGLLVNMTHEMVEAATDPFPPINVVVSGSGEIADFCTGTVAFLSPFGKGILSTYWSNARQACVTGTASAPFPAISSIATTGIGPQMNISIKGSGFGALPPPSGVPGTVDLAYLAVRNSSERWEAANSLDGNAILGQVASWTPGDIELTGFTSPAGFLFNILPSETLSFIVCNPASGGCSTTTTTLPQGAILSSITPARGPAAGNTPVVIKGSGFSAPIQVKFGSLTATAPTLVSSGEIHVSTPASLPGAAVVQVISGTMPSSQETFTYCRPGVFNLNPKSGPAAGGTQVTVTGNCFTDATSVRFGVKTGSALHVNNDSSISIKAPAATSTTACGFVSVLVSSPDLNGSVSSAPNINARFTYGNPADCLPDGDHGSFCDTHPTKCPRPRSISGNARLQARAAVASASPADRASAALQDAISRGLLQQGAPGTREPAQFVTRGDFALAMSQLFEFQELEGPPYVFNDVDSHDLSYPAFRRVQPFMTPYPGPGGAYTFYPSLPMEREEAAAAVVSILVHAGKLTAADGSQSPSLARLKDVGRLNQRLAPSVGLALEHSLLSASDAQEFRPRAFLTRSEFALLLQQLEK
ncbi:MAG TPA: IPT/TIG domain-containing protein [Candidatus Dormibacteraeota bacterium]|nr:IPT/TIG domain-containing protein [Candidatus Dormibacteraeota bacterium]